MSQEPKPIRPSADVKTLKNVQPSEAAPHEASGKKQKRSNKVGDLNLTAMLDVCFQLLIFFILTSSFTVGEGVLPAYLPFGQGPEKKDDEPPEQPLNIVISSTSGEDVTILLEGQQGGVSDFNTLYSQLVHLRKNVYSEDSPVNIRPDPTVKWKHVVNGFNQAVRAKFKNVNFAQVQ